MDLDLLRDVAIAIGLGLLVGLQREWADKKVAGIRTFALIAALGALCGLLLRGRGEPVAIAAGLIAVAVILGIGNVRRGEANPGVTTEVAGLVVFMVGAMVMIGHAPIAVVITGLTSILLHWKRPMHRTVQGIGAEDFQAIVRLVLIGLVILPLMPNEAYGPYEVVNPFKIWLMVVLIVGISLAAYAVQKMVGPRAGTLLAGVLGGLISSTATTVSYARLARSGHAKAFPGAIVIMAASTVVFGRLLFELAVVAPGTLGKVALPLAVMMAFMMAVTLVALRTSRGEIRAPAQEEAPSNLRAAVIFGLLYAGVLVAVAAVQDAFGDDALFIVAGVSGLVDMSAITLSTAQLMNAGLIETATGWRLILVGAIANMVFKTGAVAVLGTPELLRRTAVLLGISAAGCVALLMLWP